MTMLETPVTDVAARPGNPPVSKISLTYKFSDRSMSGDELGRLSDQLKWIPGVVDASASRGNNRRGSRRDTRVNCVIAAPSEIVERVMRDAKEILNGF